MKFIADLHVHSKYSRATAKNLDLEHLYIAAQIKGITVVGTGDFTHPAWFTEIEEKLVPAESGLFKLKDDLAEKCDNQVPVSCRQPVRFVLSTEISSIYKKNLKTRKNHNLVLFPDLESVRRFNTRLDGIGNIHSDGRPILGLDARNLLEIMLEIDDQGFLVPAHIWTPWFSMLGSKSGFDTLEECFEDLSGYIFAAETGLSSDPAMNWRLSGLDGLTLISNSDAHSPFNLGREANIFNTPLSYFAIKDALKTGDPDKFLGTFEFFPEEGKYHYDGHRKCEFCCNPRESLDHNGICPVCHKPLTLGVLYRVEELADREPGSKPASSHDFHSIIPLTAILSDILKVGPASKKVKAHFDQAVHYLGPEFDILHNLPWEDLNKAKIPLLAKAIQRVRTGNVKISPGFDGEFGKIKIFSEQEHERLMGQKPLFGSVTPKVSRKKKPFKSNPWQLKPSDKGDIKSPLKMRQAPLKKNSSAFDLPEDILNTLNENQKQAVFHNHGPLLISAGPGTGKTRTLTHRIAYLISKKSIDPEAILALTFTQKAAGEMKKRLTALISQKFKLPYVGTFHGFCNDLLSAQAARHNLPGYTIISDKVQKYLVSTALELVSDHEDNAVDADAVLNFIITAKQSLLSPDDDFSGLVSSKQLPLLIKLYKKYQNLLAFQNLADYEDLIFNAVKLLENEETTGNIYHQRFSHILVDEYQDLNHGQYRIIKALSPAAENLCVIGDPNQAIYGFRGSDPSYFNRFMTDFNNVRRVTLTQNYRSAETILTGAAQIIHFQSDVKDSLRISSGIKGIEQMGIICSPTEKSEAVAVGKLIEKMLGGIGFHSMDFGLTPETRKTERSFSDFAVLYRTRSQGRVIANALRSANIPCRIADKDSVIFEKGIRELLALLRIIEGRATFFDFEQVVRLPGSGIGVKTLNSFKQWYFNNPTTFSKALADCRRFPLKPMTTGSQLKLDQFIKSLFQIQESIKSDSVSDKLVYLSKIPLIKHLIDKNAPAKDHLPMLFNMASAFQYDAKAFCANLNLLNDNDFYDSKAEKVALMTLHASKGLEFPVVFICGCEQGLIPYYHNDKKPEDESAERRLFYVAMTRAKEDLYFCWAKKRSIQGKYKNRSLSPYVSEIEKQFLRKESPKGFSKKSPAQCQLSLF